MRRTLVACGLVLAGLVSGASAQITAPPLTATIVNFDDLSLPPDLQIPLPVVTDQYASRGVVFAGFGQNAGGLVNPDFGQPPPPWFSPPNIVYFVSIFPVATGGLAQSPETLSFYPPVTSFQFDSSSLNVDCAGTSVVTVRAFAPGGALLGTVSVPVTPDGQTLAMTFPAPGAEKVVVSSSHTCGPPGTLFNGVEVFSMDNVAFVSSSLGVASKCAQSAIDAAGKKAKAEASCNAKALQNGVPVDPACIQKAVDNFNKGFAKAEAAGDCQTDADVATVESSVDTLIFNAIQLVTNGSPGPDVCFGKKLTAIGKKAQSITKCYSKAAKSGVTVDEACAEKAGNSFNSSLKKCGTPTQLGPVEALIDQFGTSLNRDLTVPTTTTTTTTTSTTTTTTAPPLGPHLTFTTVAGTANCNIPPDPPFSGEIDSDAAGTTKISDLGAGCLYIGGGAAAIPPSQIPENAASILNSPDGTNLTASFGTGPADCTRGPSATKHCITDPTVSCTDDSECGGLTGSCAADANCFFGPPVPVNGFPSTCVVNTFAADASGTVNTTTGDSSVNITLASRVYLTLGQPSTCPHLRRRHLQLGRERRAAPCTTVERGADQPGLPAGPGHLPRHVAGGPEPAHHRTDHQVGRRRAVLFGPVPSRRLRASRHPGDPADGRAVR